MTKKRGPPEVDSALKTQHAEQVWYIGDAQHEQASTLACECRPTSRRAKKKEKPTRLLHVYTPRPYIARADDRASHCFCRNARSILKLNEPRLEARLLQRSSPKNAREPGRTGQTRRRGRGLDQRSEPLPQRAMMMTAMNKITWQRGNSRGDRGLREDRACAGDPHGSQ